MSLRDKWNQPLELVLSEPADSALFRSLVAELEALPMPGAIERLTHMGQPALVAAAKAVVDRASGLVSEGNQKYILARVAGLLQTSIAPQSERSRQQVEKMYLRGLSLRAMAQDAGLLDPDAPTPERPWLWVF